MGSIPNRAAFAVALLLLTGCANQHVPPATSPTSAPTLSVRNSQPQHDIQPDAPPLEAAVTKELYDSVEHGGETPLMKACWNNQPQTAQSLIDSGAAVGAKNRLGWTALMSAAR